MRPRRTGIAIALLTTALAAGMARAQSSYPCTETNANLPNPYRQVTDWASPPRPWNPVNAVAVDRDNNLWVADRCETDDCVPVIELSPDGKTLRNFGAGLFVEPHQVAVDRDGNIWVADASAKGGKGMQVTKLSPDGRVLLKLGKPGVGAGQSGLDIFDSPTGVAVASTGDIYISEGHGERAPNNSRIMVFSKDGKFKKTFATRGSGDGQLRSPHALAFDSQDHLYVADRGNSRVAVFDRDGKFLTAWKQFGRPSGVAVDANDMLYVIDFAILRQSRRRQLQSRLPPRHPHRQREGRQGNVLYSPAGAQGSEVAAADRHRGRPRRRHLRGLGRPDGHQEICEELTRKIS